MPYLAVVQIKQFLQSRVVFAVAIKARMTQLLREKGHKLAIVIAPTRAPGKALI